MAPNFDWAIKLAIEKICDRLPPDTVEQVNQVVAAGLSIKKQLDRIEYVQIEILKMLSPALSKDSAADQGQALNGFSGTPNTNSIGNGTSSVAGNLEPPAATGE
jgi:hypothetical protein